MRVVVVLGLIGVFIAIGLIGDLTWSRQIESVKANSVEYDSGVRQIREVNGHAGVYKIEDGPNTCYLFKPYSSSHLAISCVVRAK